MTAEMYNKSLFLLQELFPTRTLEELKTVANFAFGLAACEKDVITSLVEQLIAKNSKESIEFAERALKHAAIESDFGKAESKIMLATGSLKKCVLPNVLKVRTLLNNGDIAYIELGLWIVVVDAEQLRLTYEFDGGPSLLTVLLNRGLAPNAKDHKNFLDYYEISTSKK